MLKINKLVKNKLCGNNKKPIMPFIIFKDLQSWLQEVLKEPSERTQLMKTQLKEKNEFLYDQLFPVYIFNIG